MNDLKFAFRQLRKNPGFTAVAILTLAIGIGATTAIYTVVDRALLNPLSAPGSDRLMQIAEMNKRRAEAGGSFHGVSPPALRAVREQPDLFEQSAWSHRTSLMRNDGEFKTRVSGANVSSEFFSIFGARPKLGRLFAADETTELNKSRRPAVDSVIVISHRFWNDVLGGAPEALGGEVELDGQKHTVIGVMPTHFEFPYGGCDFWIAVEDPKPRPRTMSAPNWQIFARLWPGDTEQQVRSKLSVIGHRLKADLAAGDTKADKGYLKMIEQGGDWGLQMRELKLMFANQKLQRTYAGLFGAIIFVLLIVCANMANLMLARSERRMGELALHSALGASRWRLLRRTLMESLLLGVAGGAAGIAVTLWMIKLLTAFMSAWTPRLRAFDIDWGVMAATFAISAGAGGPFGMAPALRALRGASFETLKDISARASSSAGWRRYRGGLVVTEIALALVLLAGAGLMIQSVNRLLNVEPGFQPENLMFVYVSLPWNQYAGMDEAVINRRNAMLAELRERIAALPGVESAALWKESWAEEFQVEGRDEPVKLLQSGMSSVGGDFFQTAGMPLLAGRALLPGDARPDGGAVVVSKSTADALWPEANPIGRTLRQGRAPRQKTWSVVGVVGDARFHEFHQDIEPTVYHSHEEFDLAGAPPVVAVRTTGDPTALTAAIRGQLKAAEPAMGTPSIGVADENLYKSTATRRTFRNWLAAFAVVGIVLAALGIYGVVAFSVAQRTREFGIRMALGADRPAVIRLVMREGVRLIALGVVVGLLAARGLTRFLENQLFEINATDGGVLTIVALGLLLIAASACFIPARRAASSEPMNALRHE